MSAPMKRERQKKNNIARLALVLLSLFVVVHIAVVVVVVVVAGVNYVLEYSQ